jgi:hypothetical protein
MAFNIAEALEEVMMKILFNEQDLIDSACVFVANRYNEDIRDIQAELHHEQEKGISAVTTVKNDRKTYTLSEQDIIDATAIYLDEYHNFDPIQLSIELLYEEDKGISAVIDKREESY